MLVKYVTNDIPNWASPGLMNFNGFICKIFYVGEKKYLDKEFSAYGGVVCWRRQKNKDMSVKYVC